ncbi:MAG: hypothetical protein ACI8T1_003171, partial [Verrucomicrobiales bacterium]
MEMLVEGNPDQTGLIMTWFLVILCQTTLWSGAALFIARRWKDRHPSLRRRLWTVSLPMTLILPLFSPVLQLDRVLGWSALNFSEQSKVVGELPELVPAVPSGTFEGFDAGSAMAMAIEPAPPRSRGSSSSRAAALLGECGFRWTGHLSLGRDALVDSGLARA